MLVLSRREDDKILFPNLGISVKILRVEGNKVRVGVEAPRDVRVLRHELASQTEQSFSPAAIKSDTKRKQHLQSASEILEELRRISEATLDRRTEQCMLELFHHLKGIDNQISEDPSGTQQESPGETEECVLPRALLVEDNANEARLLASYLRTKQ